MKITHLLLTVVLALGAGFGGANIAGKAENTAHSTSAESAFERVQRTKTIRCGYVDYEPANFKDPATGAMKGILVDIAEAVGKQTGHTIEWVQSGGWATFITDLETNKYDVFCGAAWGILPREYQAADATQPIYFSAVSAWVAANSTRFDAGLGNVNDASVTIAATDGSLPMTLARERFPNAKILSLPETADYATNLLNVADGKADIGFVEQYIGNKYSAANPGQVKNITPNNPVRISPNVFEVRKGEHELLSMIDMALNTLRYNGEIDALISKYEPAPGTFLRQPRPYQ